MHANAELSQHPVRKLDIKRINGVFHILVWVEEKQKPIVYSREPKRLIFSLKSEKANGLPQEPKQKHFCMHNVCMLCNVYPSGLIRF